MLFEEKNVVGRVLPPVFGRIPIPDFIKVALRALRA